MSQQSFCSWCGTDNAPLQCHCRRVNYCHQQCQHDAYTEHKLTCPSAKPSSKKNKLKYGDIVRIQGLASEEGQRINGKLAEVQLVHKDTGRVRVILTLDGNIKAADIKNTNLVLEMSVYQAIQRHSQTESELSVIRGSMKTQECLAQIERMQKRLLRMRPETILRRIRNGDMYTILAIAGAGMESWCRLPYSVAVGMFEDGLIEACLDKFSFPNAMDSSSGLGYPMSCYATVIINCFAMLDNGTHDGKRVRDKWMREMAKQLNPVIWTMSSKKRRFYNSTTLWFSIQTPLIQMACACLAYIFEDGGALQKDLIVTETFTKHLVMCVFIDTSLFLDVACVSDVGAMKGCVEDVKTVALRCLGVLLSSDISLIPLIGKLAAPAGAGRFTGRPFAGCFLDYAPNLFAAIKGNYYNENEDEDQCWALILLIYRCFCRCPGLEAHLGDINHEFLALDGWQTFETWAQARLDGSA